MIVVDTSTKTWSLLQFSQISHRFLAVVPTVFLFHFRCTRIESCSIDVFFIVVAKMGKSKRFFGYFGCLDPISPFEKVKQNSKRRDSQVGETGQEVRSATTNICYDKKLG